MFVDADIGNILLRSYLNFFLVILHEGEVGTDYAYSFKLSDFMGVTKSRYMFIYFIITLCIHIL